MMEAPLPPAEARERESLETHEDDELPVIGADHHRGSKRRWHLAPILELEPEVVEGLEARELVALHCTSFDELSGLVGVEENFSDSPLLKRNGLADRTELTSAIEAATHRLKCCFEF